MKFASIQKFVFPASLILFSFCNLAAEGQELEDPPQAAFVIQTTAANAQNGGDFELAIDQWKDLLNRFPKTNATVSWQYNLGVCQNKTKDYGGAVETLNQVIAAAGSDFDFIQECYLYLGFSQLALAKQNSSDEETSRRWAMSSSKTFQTMTEKFDGDRGKYTDQALYFQGEALGVAGQARKAITIYRMLVEDLPNSKYWTDGAYALGATYQELAEFDEAIVSFDLLLAKVPEGEVVTDVKLRKAESLVQIGIAEESAGERAAANKNFEVAEKLYAEVAEVNGFVDQSYAAYKRAACFARMGMADKAAEAYSSFANKYPDSDLAGSARLAAGQFSMKANNTDEAENNFKTILEKDPSSATAAHLLCQIYRKSDRAAEAYQLAEQVLNAQPEQLDAANVDDVIRLRIDQGDAAFNIPERLQESIDLYLAIVNDHPQHRLAPRALYNACFSAFQAKQNEKSIELANKFYTAYSESDFVAEVGEVHAESLLQSNRYSDAEIKYKELLSVFSDNSKFAVWQIGLAQSLNLQKKYDDTIELLANVDHNVPRLEAESKLYLGQAYFQKQKFEEAANELTESTRADSNWYRADETMLLLARTQQQLGQLDVAIKTAETCLDNYPQSIIIDQMYFRLGELAYQQGEYAKAKTFYQKIVDLERSSMKPSALYGLGWAHTQSGEFDKAAETFSTLIDEFPEHRLNADAVVGRGISLNKAKKYREAIEDFDKFLKTNSSDEQRTKVEFERAMALAELDDPTATIGAFEKLVNDSGDSPLSAQFLYQLAWAYNSNNEKAKATERFKQLADNHPQSEHAAEASFHVGEADYDAQRYDDAILRYTFAKENSNNDSLSEMVAYKQGYAFYMKGDFETAEKTFREKVAEFENGKLKADGLFMIAESLFKQKDDFEKAETAYKTALPEVLSSEIVSDQVKTMTRFHGAQAANKTQNYSGALEFLAPILSEDDEANLYHEIWFEYGQALKGTGKIDEAVAAWDKARLGFGKTGARACCMIGEVYFEKKEFDQAIKHFKLAIYGYGGQDAAETVKPWQAFASYEAARCMMIQANQADNQEQKQKLVSEAKQWFGYLLEHYKDDRLAAEAKKKYDQIDQQIQNQ